MKIILVTHGNLSKEIINTCEMICGKIKDIYSVTFNLGESPEDLKEKITNILSNKGNDNIIFLVDFKGGTPYNVVLNMTNNASNSNKNKVITGVNLPMIIELAFQDSEDIDKIENLLLTTGRNSITTYSNIIVNDEEF